MHTLLQISVQICDHASLYFSTSTDQTTHTPQRKLVPPCDHLPDIFGMFIPWTPWNLFKLPSILYSIDAQRIEVVGECFRLLRRHSMWATVQKQPRNRQFTHSSIFSIFHFLSKIFQINDVDCLPRPALSPFFQRCHRLHDVRRRQLGRSANIFSSTCYQQAPNTLLPTKNTFWKNWNI